MRICIFGWKGSLPTTKILEWRNVVVLQLYFCSDVKELNLSGLRSLCHLELVGLEKLVMLTFSNVVVEDGSWSKPIEGQSLTTSAEELGPPTSLKILSLSQCSSLTSLPKGMGNLISLTTVDLSQCVSLTTLPEEIANWSSLRTLDLSNCRSLIRNMLASPTINLPQSARHILPEFNTFEIFQKLKFRFNSFDGIVKLLFVDIYKIRIRRFVYIAPCGNVYMAASTVNGVPCDNEWMTWLAEVYGVHEEVFRQQVLVFDLGYNVYVTCDGCLDLEINLSSGQRGYCPIFVTI